MADRKYVEATADGYYNGGYRVRGARFWITDGEKDFAKSWMKLTDPSSAPKADAVEDEDQSSEAVSKLEDDLKAANDAVEEKSKAIEALEADKKTAVEALDAEKKKVADAEKLAAEADKKASDLSSKLAAANAEIANLKSAEEKPSGNNAGKADGGKNA